MKRFIIASLAVSLVTSVALADPSAKFAATYTKGIGLASVAYVSGTADAVKFDFDAGYTLARIKVPQDKELLVGVSADIGLVTDTSVKGQNGGAARSIAGSGAGVIVFAVPVGSKGSDAIAEPGFVVLNSRVQVLDATLGGVIQSCTPEDDGSIVVADDCVVTPEEIGLILGTMSANHFNFVLPDMDQGEYNLVAFFVTGAGASINIDEATVEAGGSISASSFALAFVGKTMVTVQQVRAAKGGVIESEIDPL
jgi:hypothetical protein